MEDEQRYCLAHLGAGAILGFVDKPPRETLALVATVEFIERTKWASKFPKLLRARGPFVIDLISTMAGYALVRSLKK